MTNFNEDLMYSLKLPNKEKIPKNTLHMLKSDEERRKNRSGIDNWRFQTRYNKIYDWINEGNILDMGCAESLFALPLSMQHKVIALDVNIDFLLYSSIKSKMNQLNNVNFVCASGLHTPFKNECFDNVHLGQIIEHLLNPEVLLKETKRILKENGRVIIVTPLRPLETRYSIKDRERVISKVSKYDSSPTQHVFEFTPSELEELLKNCGFNVLKLEVFETLLRSYKGYFGLVLKQHIFPPLRTSQILGVAEKTELV